MLAITKYKNLIRTFIMFAYLSVFIYIGTLLDHVITRHLFHVKNANSGLAFIIILMCFNFPIILSGITIQKLKIDIITTAKLLLFNVSLPILTPIEIKLDRKPLLFALIFYIVIIAVILTWLTYGRPDFDLKVPLLFGLVLCATIIVIIARDFILYRVLKMDDFDLKIDSTGLSYQRWFGIAHIPWDKVGSCRIVSVHDTYLKERNYSKFLFYNQNKKLITSILLTNRDQQTAVEFTQQLEELGQAR